MKGANAFHSLNRTPKIGLSYASEGQDISSSLSLPARHTTPSQLTMKLIFLNQSRAGPFRNPVLFFEVDQRLQLPWIPFGSDGNIGGLLLWLRDQKMLITRMLPEYTIKNNSLVEEYMLEYAQM